MNKPHSSTAIYWFVDRCAVRNVCSVAVLVMYCAAVLAGCPAVGPTGRPQQKIDLLRTYNGVEGNSNDFLFVVALLRQFKIRICTGTLIAPTWVLSTAHCSKATHIQYGDMTVPRENITSMRAILKYITHPSYQVYKYLPNQQTYYNDIGLILVERVPSDYGELSALDYHSLTGFQVKYIGLGITNITDKKTYDNTKPRQLAYGVIASCKDVANELYYYPKICVAPQCSKPQSAMPGDSGGPLLMEKKVIGITVGILYDPRITIFTPVSPFLTWIRGVMDQNEVVAS